MPNPLDWFRKDLQELEAALQGDFGGAFLIVLAEAVKNHGCSEAEWGACIKIMIQGTKKPADLTVGDFLQALREVRGAKNLQASRWTPRAPGKKPDWDRMAEAITADPVAPEASKEIARFLAVRKGSKLAQEPVRRGGEKHRTKPL